MNQFYVQPPQFGQGLQSLAGSVDKFQAERKLEATEQAEAARKQMLQKKMQAVINPDTGQADPKALTDLILTDPDIGGAVRNQLGLVDEQQKTQALNRATSLKQVLKTASPEQAMQIFQQEGYANDPVFAGLADNLQSGDIEGAMNELQYGVAAVGGQSALDAFMGLSGQGEDASTRHFNYLLNLAQNGTPDQQRAARIELGTLPRAGISAAERIAQDPTVTQQVAQSGAVIEGAKESGKLEAQLQMKPEVEAAVRQAVADVETSVAQSGEARSNDKAMNIYNSAMGNLVKSLGGTITGPFVSLAPALSSNAQIAEGASAMMAPVLKTMFREAGEGTFTKDDQAVLMNMLPSRDTLPDARKAQMLAIDALVRAKLGQPAAAQPAFMEEAETAQPSIDDLINKYGN